MALRSTQRRRNLEKLNRRNYTVQLRQAELTPGVGAGMTLGFGKGLSVLCGLNGAGKSSVLGALWRGLTDEEPPDHLPRMPEWLETVEITGIQSGSAWTSRYSTSAQTDSLAAPAPVVYLDPAAEAAEIYKTFRDDTNYLDLIEGLDPTEFDSEALELLSFIVGRSYDRVHLYEITAFSETEVPIPYFHASSKGTQYSLLRMGRGELNACYLVWKLWSLEPGTIVLLEEPEANLAFRSQQALIEGLVSLVVDRDITVVTSSHTPGFFRSLPDGSATLLQALPKPVINSTLRTLELANYLDLDSQGNFLMIVEDYVAEAMLRAVLQEQASPELRSAATRYTVSGESGVEKVLAEILTRHPKNGRVVGVLDGDQRKNKHAVAKFLPGDDSPERVLRESVRAWERGRYEDWNLAALGGSDKFRMQLELNDGLEDHDWLMALANSLGGLEVVVGSLVKLALMNSAFNKQADELVSALETDFGLSVA